MAAPWTNPTQNGEQIVMWLLAKEGRSPNDPLAVYLAQQAITDAQLWIWRRRDWWWARRVSARFDAVPTTFVVKDSAAAATTLHVADTDEFAVGDVILIDEDGTKEEIATISAITANVSFTLAANLVNSHDADDAAPVVKLAETVHKSVQTRVDAASSSVTLNVEETEGFSAGDLIEIAPGTSSAEINKISAVTGTTSGSFTLYGRLKNSHSTSRVVQVSPGKRSYALRSVNNGAMRDLGQVMNIRVEADGELTPMTRYQFEQTYENDYSGRLTAGDRYLIEGDPPTLRFERTPSASQQIVVDYLALPSRYEGSENIMIPAPFQDLLRYVARWYFRDDDQNRIPLEQDPVVQSRMTEMAGWSPQTPTAEGMVRPIGERAVLVGLHRVRPEDFLDVDGVPIN